MPPFFQRLEDLPRGFRLGFGDAAGHPQPRVHVDHRGAPELAAGGGLGIIVFSPLLPT